MAAPITAIDALLTACSQYAQDIGVLKIINTETKKTGYFYLHEGYVYGAQVEGTIPEYRKRMSSLHVLNEFVDLDSVIKLAGGEDAVALPFLLAQSQIADESIIKTIAIDFLLQASAEILSWQRVKVKWHKQSQEHPSLVSVEGGQILNHLARRDNNIEDVLEEFETTKENMNVAVLRALNDVSGLAAGLQVEARAVYDYLVQQPVEFGRLPELFGFTEYSSYRAIYNLWSVELIQIDNLRTTTSEEEQASLAYEEEQQQIVEDVERDLTEHITLPEEETVPELTPEPLPMPPTASLPMGLPERPQLSTRLPERPQGLGSPSLSGLLGNTSTQSSEVSNEETLSLPVSSNVEDVPSEDSSPLAFPTLNSDDSDPIEAFFPATIREDEATEEETLTDVEPDELAENPLAGFESLYEVPEETAPETEVSPSDLLAGVFETYKEDIPSEQADISAPEDATPIETAPSDDVAPSAGLLAQIQQLMSQAAKRKEEIAVEQEGLNSVIAEADAEREEAERLLAEGDAIKQQIEEEQAEANTLNERINELTEELSRLNQEYATKQEQINALDSDQERLVADGTSQREQAIEKEETARQKLARLDAELEELTALPSL